MDDLRVLDCLPNGQITIPPSKSASHRALICAALATGKSRIDNIKHSEDIVATLACAKALGVHFTQETGAVLFNGNGPDPKDDAVLDCGESGSTLRFMIPIALLFDKELHLTGHGRLMQRPLKAYKEALEENGAEIEQNDDEIIVKGPIRPGTYSFSGSVSSQYVTGLLFALPLLDGDSKIVLTSPLESKGYVDMTIDMLNQFGIVIKNENYERFIINGNQTYKANDHTVEGDYSAVAFFLAAGALGCDVKCYGLKRDSLQGDKAFLDILKKCGVDITQKDGTIQALPSKIQAITVDVKDIPDLVPPLTALLCFAEGESKIINAGRLRLKESDRLHALATEFNNLGAKIVEGEDCLTIQGVKTLTGGVSDAHNDHRIAMAIAVASIKSTGKIELHGASSVNKSYPAFWDDFCKIERSIDHE